MRAMCVARLSAVVWEPTLPASLLNPAAGGVEPWSTARNGSPFDMTFERRPVFVVRFGCVIADAASFPGHACNARGAVIGGRLGTDPTGEIVEHGGCCGRTLVDCTWWVTVRWRHDPGTQAGFPHAIRLRDRGRGFVFGSCVQRARRGYRRSFGNRPYRGWPGGH